MYQVGRFSETHF